MWGRKDGVASPGEVAVLGNQAKTLPVGLCLPVQGMRTEHRWDEGAPYGMGLVKQWDPNCCQQLSTRSSSYI